MNKFYDVLKDDEFSSFEKDGKDSQIKFKKYMLNKQIQEKKP
jgi:hypothetical protein